MIGTQGYGSQEIDDIMAGQGGLSSMTKQKYLANTFAQSQGEPKEKQGGLLESFDAVNASQMNLEEAKANLARIESVRDESYESISARTADFSSGDIRKDKD